jgi:hypothetical protein
MHSLHLAGFNSEPHTIHSPAGLTHPHDKGLFATGFTGLKKILFILFIL